MLKHGESRTQLYFTWLSMKRRCDLPTHEYYPYYGGRGIKVCKAWSESYVSFRDWIKKQKWKPGLQIDRINNDRGYSPSNCRLVTSRENNRNRRSNVLIKAFGEEKCLAEWVEDKRCSVSHSALRRRVHAGWDPERALTQQNRIGRTHIVDPAGYPRKHQRLSACGRLVGVESLVENPTCEDCLQGRKV